MIAAADGQEPVFFRPVQGLPVLQRHLERHFHADRAGITKEEVLQRRRRHAQQAPAQCNGRLVSEAAEHHKIGRAHV